MGLSRLYLRVFAKQKIPLILMLGALIGLLALQAFWIYESVRTHNRHMRSKISRAEAVIKKELEDDYFCFTLSRITSIDRGDSLAIFSYSNSKLDTLRSYRLESEDTSMIYPKDVFAYGIPMWLQMELRFDYLLDSLSEAELRSDPELLELQQEYRRDALIDSTNGVRVGYRNSMDRIVRKNLLTIDLEELTSYALYHGDSDRMVYSTGESKGLPAIMEVGLYDDKRRFAESYTLRIYSGLPWMRTLRELTPFLIASLFIVILAIGVFSYGLNAWRKERMLSGLRTDMMHSLSHEMNTPISNIGLALQSIRKKNGEYMARNGVYLDILQEENTRLADNVSRLMDYAQMEEHKMIFELRKVELNELLQRVLDSFDTDASAEDSRLEFFRSEEPLWVLGDENHLVNVFHNLLGNAFKYSQDTPRIEVRTAKQGKHAEIRFMDNNVPIEHEARKKVFEKYYRGQESSDDSIQGYGLGLYYVRKVVRQLGGKVALSESYYGGNSFVLRLPLIP